MAKILLVDDHPDIVRLLEMTLTRDHHTVFKAYDGAQALRMVEECRPDLVILDVVMPEIDGYRVLNRIKTNPELAGTTVVMLTCRNQPEDVTLGLDIGADFYLGKPFRPSELLSLVRRLSHNQDGGTPPPPAPEDPDEEPIGD